MLSKTRHLFSDGISFCINFSKVTQGHIQVSKIFFEIFRDYFHKIHLMIKLIINSEGIYNCSLQISAITGSLRKNVVIIGQFFDVGTPYGYIRFW